MRGTVILKKQASKQKAAIFTRQSHNGDKADLNKERNVPGVSMIIYLHVSALSENENIGIAQTQVERNASSSPWNKTVLGSGPVSISGFDILSLLNLNSWNFFWKPGFCKGKQGFIHFAVYFFKNAHQQNVLKVIFSSP